MQLVLRRVHPQPALGRVVLNTPPAREGARWARRGSSTPPAAAAAGPPHPPPPATIAALAQLWPTCQAVSRPSTASTAHPMGRARGASPAAAPSALAA